MNRNFARDIREREIDQKFLYTEAEGCLNYYESCGASRPTSAKNISLAYVDIYKKHITAEEHTAFVGLGCGNAEIDKTILLELIKQDYPITYIGVDTSEAMLEMAEKNLKELPIKKVFIQADMLSDAFKKEIVEHTKDCSRSVYGMFGGTFGNVNQTDISDSLYNLMNKKDLLFVDFVVRESTSLENELELFNHYTKFLQGRHAEFVFHPLELIGVPFESGSITMKTENEVSIGCLTFRYYFQFEDKVVIDYNGQRVHFLPNEEIKLLTVRVYHVDTFTNFFHEHDFDRVDFVQIASKGILVFQPQDTQKNHVTSDVEHERVLT